MAYTNGGNAARTALLRVNGEQATTVPFPPTGSWTTPGDAHLRDCHGGKNQSWNWLMAS